MCSEALRSSHSRRSTNAGTSWCRLLEHWDHDFLSAAPPCTVQSCHGTGTWKMFWEWLMCGWKNWSWVLCRIWWNELFSFKFHRLQCYPTPVSLVSDILWKSYPYCWLHRRKDDTIFFEALISARCCTRFFVGRLWVGPTLTLITRLLGLGL